MFTTHMHEKILSALSVSRQLIKEKLWYVLALWYVGSPALTELLASVSTQYVDRYSRGL